MSILSALGTILAGKGLEKAVKGVSLDKVLEVGSRWIPDEEGKRELEKAALEAEVEILKTNKPLLDKVIPLTFPAMCWIISLNFFVYIVIGSWTFYKTGQWVAIPIQAELYSMCKMFLSILGGKWLIKEVIKR